MPFIRPRSLALLLGALLLVLLPSASATAATDLKINFQPSNFSTPSGYTADTGAAFSDATGRGWVREDSLASATHVGFDMSDMTRRRWVSGSPENITLIHVEKTTSPVVRGAYEIALPNGAYKVSVGVGDPSNYDSRHVVNAEGQQLGDVFIPSSSDPKRTLSGTVLVSDGRLTLTGTGGVNTKLDWVSVQDADTDTTPPSAPTALTARGGAGKVILDWTKSPEADVAGYNVYRSATLPVDTTGTPRNGSTLVTSSTFDDTAKEGETWNYVVVAVDFSLNRSAASNSASGSPTAPALPGVDLKINFQPAGSATPLGYVADTGRPYDASLGRGWVREDSLPNATRTGLDLTSKTRSRMTATDRRLDTFIHMQTSVMSPMTRGAYEVKLPVGTYKVTVAVGDATNFDSNHVVNIEGQRLIDGFVPTPQEPFKTVTGTFAVNDGALTLDELNGSNTKLDYLEIKDAPADEQPPAVPTNVKATAGTETVTLRWTANTDSDLAGYQLYRSTTTPVSTTGTPLSGSSLLTGTTYNDTAVVAGRTYYYRLVAVDRSSNRSAGSDETSATPEAPPAAAYEAHVNFTKAGSAQPAGYTNDIGAPYDATRTYGWVREDSLASDPIPLDVQVRTRNRWNVSDPKLGTLVHMAGDYTPAAAWQAKVPNGDYSVTVGVGDPSNFDSRHVIRAEGATLIDFAATTENRQAVATGKVSVRDGMLTIDSVGGTNTKLQYIDLISTGNGDDTEAPAAPVGLTSAADVNGIHLSWTPNAEADLGGYFVYRSTELPVDTTRTPISGTTPIATSSFDDTTGKPTVPYYYAIVAVDRSGNASEASNPVTAKQPVIPVDRKFNFQPANAPTVFGYTVDSGEAWTNQRGYGWVTEASVRDADPSTHVPLSLTARVRDRNKVADQRLDTLEHMQFSDTEKGAWEVAVPNGSYDVALSVGDPTNTDSLHTINVEGTRFLTEFLPTQNSRFRTVSATVAVADGRLTIDAIGGTNTKINYLTVVNADTGTRPSIAQVSPADGATLVSRTRAVTAELDLPNVGAGVDGATLDSDSVYLERIADGSRVSANVNTSGGGDVVVLQPRSALQANTTFRFTVTSALKDVSGASFVPKTSTFTTGESTSTTTSPARFIKDPQEAGAGELMASLVIGPDQRLYATTLDGKIIRFPIDAATGQLGTPTEITTIADNENGPRSTLGLAFDPASTAENPILWVSHGHPAYVGAPDWTGKISKLTGPNLGTIQDVVVGLPRSVRDHQTNSLAFGPDGALYLTQGSSSATGEPDDAWGQRPEHLLTGAVLRLDTAALSSLPLDVKTADGGTYDPYAAGAPLTIYSSGVRNAYDLVWANNGELYVPTNGSAAGGNTPSTPSTLPATCAKRPDVPTLGPWTGPAVAGQSALGVQPDILIRAQKGKYYGHPNASRCEFTFMGGNPTSSIDPYELVNYPVGTQPDRNFARPSWNFGNHFSPNGAIQYQGNAWNGALKDQLLVTRYSAGDDLVALKIDPTTKDVVDQQDGIPGLGGFVDPLDVAQDTRNGNLYVTELGAARISLVKPDETAGTPRASVTPGRLFENAAIGDLSVPREITIRNTGNAQLRLSSIKLGGANAGDFVLDHLPSLPTIIEPDNDVTVDVRLKPTAKGIRTATVDVTTDDPAQAVRSTVLRGLGTTGYEGADEPSLQRVLDLRQIPVNVGDDTPDETKLPDGPIVGEETSAQTFRKAAGASKVTIEPIGVFQPQGPGSSVGAFGWNPLNDSEDLHTVATIPNSQYQSVDPQVDGKLSFDPGSASFGFWSSSAANDYSKVFTEDALNVPNGLGHNARGYKLKDSSGNIVPNAYVIAFEERYPAGADFQDLVMIVRGVRPDGSGEGRVELQNLDGWPRADRLVFNTIDPATVGANRVHNVSTLRLRNSGSTPLNITGLPITGPFTLDSAPTLPKALAPGETTDVRVKFTATSGRVHSGLLTVQSDAAATPSLRVELGGFWQPEPENQKEPTLAEIVNGVFGYGTRLTYPGQSINTGGRVVATGDEVLSPYWRRLDPSRTVRVTQLAAFKTQNTTATLRWFQRDGDIRRQVLQYDLPDAQSVLPKLRNDATKLAATTFSPSAEFGLEVDGEKSDPDLNWKGPDYDNGCTEPCGHHFRFWPLKTSTGQVVTGSYIAAMDYVGVNYDFNDNVYVIENVKPSTTEQPVLYRLNAGAPSGTTFRDSRGRDWRSDAGFFSPSTAKDEGTATTSITNTPDDRLYATYRGNVGLVPQDQRELSYRLPTGTATKVDVRLYFQENTWTSSGRRKFDISMEGIKLASNVDLFASAGGRNVAWSKEFSGVSLSDGALDLNLKASVDYPAISAIEVLCAETCGTD